MSCKVISCEFLSNTVVTYLIKRDFIFKPVLKTFVFILVKFSLNHGLWQGLLKLYYLNTLSIASRGSFYLSFKVGHKMLYVYGRAFYYYLISLIRNFLCLVNNFTVKLFPSAESIQEPSSISLKENCFLAVLYNPINYLFN